MDMTIQERASIVSQQVAIIREYNAGTLTQEQAQSLLRPMLMQGQRMYELLPGGGGRYSDIPVGDDVEIID